jgi:hypothetical protein
VSYLSISSVPCSALISNVEQNYRGLRCLFVVVRCCDGEALWAACYHVWHSTNAWQVACICVGLARVGLARVGVARKPHVTHLNHTYTPSNLSQRVTQRQRQQGRHSESQTLEAETDTRGRDRPTDTKRIATRRNVVHVRVLTEPLCCTSRLLHYAP